MAAGAPKSPEFPHRALLEWGRYNSDSSTHMVGSAIEFRIEISSDRPSDKRCELQSWNAMSKHRSPPA